jgi:hypothetical protein
MSRMHVLPWEAQKHGTHTEELIAGQSGPPHNNDCVKDADKQSPQVVQVIEAGAGPVCLLAHKIRTPV